VWNKVMYSSGDLKKTFAPMHEIIWFATKGKFAFADGRRPASVLTHRRPLGSHQSDRTHPTEKPVPLMRELIEYLTRPGELVIDPFCGTGATVVAAKETGRSAIGMELERHYSLIARDRVRRASVANLAPRSATSPSPGKVSRRRTRRAA